MDGSASGRVVLVVDDDAVVSALLDLAAQGIPGVKTLQSARAMEAVRLAIGHPPDLVITDMEMPERNGLWLLRQLRELGVTAPVVIHSGSLDDGDEALLRAEGAAAVIRKPKTVKELRSMMREQLSRPVRFELLAARGSEVFVAGTFNGWNTGQYRLVDNPGGGHFGATVPLLRGRHEYKFIVNGVWRTDPNGAGTVRNAFGTLNSVLEV